MKLRTEPRINVGIVERAATVVGSFDGTYIAPGGGKVDGAFTVIRHPGTVFVIDRHDSIIASGHDLVFRSRPGASFTIRDVTIGINFHWERKEDQKFEGDLRFMVDGDGISIVNEVGLERYLVSVISSEMSASSPYELLRAHAITSRSWLGAMLARRGTVKRTVSRSDTGSENEIIRWYDREDHRLFDVCADDHCQRYQGITKAFSPEAERAVTGTRGTFLVYGDSICDARFYKACGGRTEEFRNAWEDVTIPYLESVTDADSEIAPVRTEKDARSFIASSPDAWCNTDDEALLRTILPSFDQETKDFFRWTVRYSTDELTAIVRDRSGIDLGTITALEPLERGPSGRIVTLRIVGSKRTVTVGKELEIRKWLSRSHLYSSAFVVDIEKTKGKTSFLLTGAGWGHGVGLCQIGAAVMASKGRTAESIVLHYFNGAELKQLY